MGVLPLQFKDGDSRESLDLSGHETFAIEGLSNSMKPKSIVTVKSTGNDGEKSFEMIARLDTPVEVDYFRHGGILQMVLRQLAG
jgi:aconitate hydratase